MHRNARTAPDSRCGDVGCGENDEAFVTYESEYESIPTTFLL